MYLAVGLSVAVALLALLVMAMLVVGSGVLLVYVARAICGGARTEPARQPADAGVIRAAAPADLPARETDPVAVWCYRQLVHLGLDPVTALGATLAGVDSARVRSLVRRGCPPALAV